MTEGQIVHKALKDRGISVSDVAKKFEVSRTSVYKYFDSEQLSLHIKEKFKNIFNLDVDKISYSNQNDIHEQFTDESGDLNIDLILKEREKVSDQIYLTAKKLEQLITYYDDLIADFEDRIGGLSVQDPPKLNMEAARRLFFKK